MSPRPPVVASHAPLPEPRDLAPSLTTEISNPMPHIALEAALADLVAWRRDAEKKLNLLESEVAQLRRLAATAGTAAMPSAPATAPTLSAQAPKPSADATGPMPWVQATVPMPEVAPPATALPVFQPLRELPGHLAQPAAQAVAASSGIAPKAFALGPPPEPASAPAPVAPTVAMTVPMVVSIRPPPSPSRPQYDLDMRPGEAFDLPNGLDGGRRKKVLGWLVVLAILSGMAALIISAVASQR